MRRDSARRRIEKDFASTWIKPSGVEPRFSLHPPTVRDPDLLRGADWRCTDATGRWSARPFEVTLEVPLRAQTLHDAPGSNDRLQEFGHFSSGAPLIARDVLDDAGGYLQS